MKKNNDKSKVEMTSEELKAVSGGALASNPYVNALPKAFATLWPGDLRHW